MVTNYIKNATYKEIYDIHTDSESTSILTFHTPVNLFPRKMLKGFFDQYRRFKYKGATVRLQPVARLPADPEQISYEAGEPGIDPRDMVNPVLVRGYCGDSLGTFLNRYLVPGCQSTVIQGSSGGTYDLYKSTGFTGSGVDKTSFPDAETAGIVDVRSAYLEKLYYQSLGDPHFQKIGAQRGMKRFFYPLVYELATTTQYLAHNPDFTPNNDGNAGNGAYGGLVNNFDSATSSGTAVTQSFARENAHNDWANGSVQTSTDISRGTGSFYESSIEGLSATTLGLSTDNRTIMYRRTAPVLTSHKRRLGWLDTDSTVVRAPISNSGTGALVSGAYPSTGPDVLTPFDGIDVANTTLPLINMGIAILPKAYKTEMCWRLSIVHHFDFKDYRPMSGLVSPFDNANMGLTPVLEWSDWDGYGNQIYAVSSVTSTAKNVELVDVEGLNPIDMGDDLDEPVTA